MWGDGLDRHMIDKICREITDAGWSLSNIGTFGMGGGLLQKVHRDTQRFAFKCSAQERSGCWHDVYKDPINGNKSSKRGRLMLVNDSGIQTVPEDRYPEDQNLLRTVYEYGCMLPNVIEGIDVIKRRANLPWEK